MSIRLVTNLNISTGNRRKIKPAKRNSSQVKFLKLEKTKEQDSSIKEIPVDSIPVEEKIKQEFTNKFKKQIKKHNQEKTDKLD